MSFVPLSSLLNPSTLDNNNATPVDGVPVCFFKKFRTPRGHFAYDANTGMIIKLDELSYELLEWLPDPESQIEEICRELAGSFTREQVQNSVNRLRLVVDKLGMFRPVYLKTRMATPDRVRDQVSAMVGRLGNLVLSVVEQCNLRCSYCSFSGGYANMRVHNDTSMSWEVAKKAIDYFLANVGVNRSELGFYGGEPLINLALIRQCIEYTRSRDSTIGFGMTTNGTLLSESTADILVESNVRLLVSLDGPQHLHDRERTLVGGQGSYQKILDNIRKLKSRHPDYYENRVRFHCTLRPGDNNWEIFNYFFGNQELFSAGQIDYGSVAAGHKQFATTPISVAVEDSRPPLVSRYLEKVLLGEKDDREFVLLSELFEKPFLRLHSRDIRQEGYGENTHITGACFPGNFRLFVKANGRFLICPSSNDALQIGDVEHGLDLDQIVSIYERYYELHDSECRKCWVYRFCPSCYASSTRETGKFEATLNSEYCHKQRASWTRTFEQYCSVIDEKPTAFDYLSREREIANQDDAFAVVSNSESR